MWSLRRSEPSERGRRPSGRVVRTLLVAGAASLFAAGWWTGNRDTPAATTPPPPLRLSESGLGGVKSTQVGAYVLFTLPLAITNQSSEGLAILSAEGPLGYRVIDAADRNVRPGASMSVVLESNAGCKGNSSTRTLERGAIRVMARPVQGRASVIVLTMPAEVTRLLSKEIEAVCGSNGLGG